MQLHLNTFFNQSEEDIESLLIILSSGDFDLGIEIIDVWCCKYFNGGAGVRFFYPVLNQERQQPLE